MTMIELCVVMGIATVLMAMVLGLSRHVAEVVKIRRAQADLGEWHDAFSRWYVQFGEYPYEAVNLSTGNRIGPKLLDDDNPSQNLTNVLDNCYLRFNVLGGTNVTFRSFLTSAVNHIDPWGCPYIYDCDPGKKSYILFSCGSDSRSVLPVSGGGTVGIPVTNDKQPSYTLDDIYFER
jgi:Tfp pilus assembly protein PilE